MAFFLDVLVQNNSGLLVVKMKIQYESFEDVEPIKMKNSATFLMGLRH